MKHNSMRENKEKRNNYNSYIKDTGQCLKQEIWEQSQSSLAAVKKNWKVHSCSWVFIFKFLRCVAIALNFCINLRHGLWSVTMSHKHSLTPGPDPDRFWFITTVFGTWWASICQNQSSISARWVSKTLSYSSHSFTSFPLTFHAKKWVRPLCGYWQGRCPPSLILLVLNKLFPLIKTI